jgi:hypothetical protein
MIAFAVGRYTVPEKVRIETKYVKVEDKKEKTKTDKDTHKVTKVREVTRPDGTKEKVTEVVEDTESTTKKITKDKIAESGSSVTEKVSGSQKTTLSVLAGAPTTGGTPDFGASAYKPVLGPIGIGIFGFKSGLVGASIGLSF